MPLVRRARDVVGEHFDPYVEHSDQAEIEMLFKCFIEAHGPVKRLLDVGCGTGRTSAFTKRLGVEELVGIALDSDEANLAEHYMDRVIQGNPMTVEFDWDPGHFDMIFFTGVLHQPLQPAAVLERYVECLRPDGRAIVVFPDANHISIVSSLVQAEFSSQDVACLASAHKRFVTQEVADEIVTQAGLCVENLTYRLDTRSWQEVVNETRLHLVDTPGTTMAESRVIPVGLQKTYLVRTLYFLSRKPA